MNSRYTRLISLATVFALGVAFTCGCSAARMEEAAGMQELPRQTGDTKIPLESPVQVASAVKDPVTIAASLPFQLAEVPNPAKLEMLVTGIRPACPLPTLPQGRTELLVNGHQIKSLRLDHLELGIYTALWQSLSHSC